MTQFVLLGFVIFGVTLGPQLWARAVLNRYRAPRPDIRWTGGEFARKLLDLFRLSHVKVELTQAGDHYDPQAKVLRLSADNYEGRNLTAIVAAAHETGHALQDKTRYRPLLWRTALVRHARWAERVAAVALIAAPILSGVSRSTGVGLLTLVVGASSMALMSLVHLITLPVELDASFTRAMHVLTVGKYIDPADRPAARRILTACALTYLAGSLASLLNVWRWLRFLRR